MSKVVLTQSRFTPLGVQRHTLDGIPVAPTRLLRSPIPYPGSKGRVVKTIVNAMPTDWLEFREPFAGGLSLSLYLMQRYPGRRFWVNDLDPFLSCFWVAVTSEPDRLVKTLNYYLAEFPSNRDRVFLSDWARGLVHETKGVERAALYYIMSKTSFCGMPFFGCSANGRKFNTRGVQQLKAIGRMLKTVDVKVTDLDYTDCLTNDPNVFTYFDPPYLIDCYLYGKNGNLHRAFDHRRFSKAVNPLKSRWMVSYNDDLLIRRYFKAHRISTIKVPYTMASKVRATELLITNYAN
jgi:DNA adenine methylase